jgi:hypothetical protein
MPTDENPERAGTSSERELLRAEIQEQKREAASREARDSEIEQLKNRVSVAAIVLTTALTFVGNVKADRSDAAGGAISSAAAARQSGVDTWSYYQSKLAERTTLETARDRILLNLAARDLDRDAPEARLEELRLSEYEERLEGFDRDAQLVFAHIQELEVTADVEARRAVEPKRSLVRYDLGSKVITLALILLSVTILSNKSWLFWAGVALGGGGLLAAFDGYFLFL